MRAVLVLLFLSVALCNQLAGSGEFGVEQHLLYSPPIPYSSVPGPASDFAVADLEEDDDDSLPFDEESEDVDSDAVEDEDIDDDEDDVTDNDLTADDLDLHHDDEHQGWPAVVSLLEDSRYCTRHRHSRRIHSSYRCSRLRRVRRSCRPCKHISRCKCRALHVVGRLLRLRGKWRVRQLESAIQRLGEKFTRMVERVKSVSARDMEPASLIKSFKRFNWLPRRPKTTKIAHRQNTRPPRRKHGWQTAWVKWGWLQPAHPKNDNKPRASNEAGAAGDDDTPRIARHSCPGGEVFRVNDVGNKRVTEAKSAALSGNFFNDVDWSICFRAQLDCRDVNSKWQVVFGGQCGQPAVGYVGGHWVFTRQCGGAPSIAFAKAQCDRATDVSVIKKGQRLCFVVDGLQTKCRAITSKFTPYGSFSKFALGAGFHDGREMFRGPIHWVRVGSALVKEGQAPEPVDRQRGSCPSLREAVSLEKKDFIADPILQFESVAGDNCETRTKDCLDSVKVADKYAYAGARFDKDTTNVYTKWAASPAFAATHGNGATFGSEPITIKLARVINRIGLVLLGKGGDAKIEAFDDKGCKLIERAVTFETGRHPTRNFIGLTGANNITKVVVSGKSFAIDDVQFGNDDQSQTKPLKRFEVAQFNGDSRVTFESVAGEGCTIRTDECPEGKQVAATYRGMGVVLGEGARNMFSQWATSGGFAVANGPAGSYSNRPLQIFFSKPVKRVGFSLLGVGGSVRVQVFDANDMLLGATTVEYEQGKGQFAGFGGVGDIARVAIIGRGFAIDDLTFGSEAATPVINQDVVTDIGGVKAWFRADKGVNASTDGLLSAWSDQSANHFDLQQTNETMQPRVLAATLNGQPVVAFDGTDDILSNEVFTTCTHALTVFAVFNLETIAAKEGYPWAIGDHNPGFVTQESEGSATVFDVAFGFGNDKRFEIRAKTGFRLMTYAGTSKANMRVWAETKAANMEELACCHGPTEFATPALPCLNRLSLGGLNLAVPHPTRNTKVQWAELVVFDKDLSRLQREQVEEYLLKKYNITPAEDVTPQ